MGESVKKQEAFNKVLQHISELSSKIDTQVPQSKEPSDDNTVQTGNSTSQAKLSEKDTDQAVEIVVNSQFDIEVIPEYEKVVELIDNGQQLILVTGGAGTGKSTFIKYLDGKFPGQTLLCAPTGIAALTIAGKTIHSLCQFPPSWITDDDVRYAPKSLAKFAKILVIDEISMVNANMFDAMNRFFKINRSNSELFGGLVVVMVGDIFQLPPVVTSSTQPLFDAHYSSPKFFASHTIQENSYETVKLTKTFRQSDQDFVQLLDCIRRGVDLEETVAVFNSTCGINQDAPTGTITLSPRHANADRINKRRLQEIPEEIKQFAGKVTGSFNENTLPVPRVIELKVGAQVVLTKNGTGFVNGDVAVVTKINKKGIKAKLISTGIEVVVEIGTWEQFEYRFNSTTKAIEKSVIGVYEQLPAILAWAVTVHRSQGLSFDSVHLDLGSGAFENGQTYVALSRCRSIQRLTMSRPLRVTDVLVDEESVEFYSKTRT